MDMQGAGSGLRDYNQADSIVHNLSSNQEGQEQVLRKYTDLASTYEEDFKRGNYGAPKQVAEAVQRLLTSKKLNISEIDHLKVMDIAAGTGMVGSKLWDAGFRHIDALDACKEMLDILRSRKIYSRIIQDTIGGHRVDVEDNTYDLVTIAGGFVEGHCPVSTIDEMIRICKPGGFIVNSMRLEFMFIVPEYTHLLFHMQQLEKGDIWRKIEWHVSDRYFYDTKQGITHVYQKL